MKLFSFLQSKTPLCGLDLGSSWAKTVKISGKGKSPSLETFGRLPWTAGDMDNASSQGKKVRVLMDHLALKDKVVISSMAGHSVIVKRVFFKARSAKEMEQTIYKEARQYIPFDLNDVYLDFQVMNKEDKQETMEVMLVASKKKVVQDVMEVMEHSDLSLGILDVDAFALSNCFEFNYPELAHEPAYLLDIGGTQSIFSIFWQSQPVFFREMSFGGKQLTDILASRLDISRAEAEKIKLKGPAPENGPENLEIIKEMSDTIKSWSDEVKRLIGFYQTSFPDAGQARKIFLSGGGSLLWGIDSIFQDELDIETTHLDPWKNIQTPLNDFDPKYLDSVKPQFAVATGLALRGVI